MLSKDISVILIARMPGKDSNPGPTLWQAGALTSVVIFVIVITILIENKPRFINLFMIPKFWSKPQLCLLRIAFQRDSNVRFAHSILSKIISIE